MLYAGSYGRGYFRAPFPDKTANGCDYTKKARSSISYINNIKTQFDIYPNPSSDNINVSFQTQKPNNIRLSVYDMAGRLVKRVNYRALSGDNIIQSDIRSLNKGKYIVRLEDDENVIGGKIFVKD